MCTCGTWQVYRRSLCKEPCMIADSSACALQAPCGAPSKASSGTALSPLANACISLRYALLLRSGKLLDAHSRLKNKCALLRMVRLTRYCDVYMRFGRAQAMTMMHAGLVWLCQTSTSEPGHVCVNELLDTLSLKCYIAYSLYRPALQLCLAVKSYESLAT